METLKLIVDIAVMIADIIVIVLIIKSWKRW